ncbi:hypothetical protein PW035_44400, partial [Nonomuraea angiospora]|nr:hypothetical protein [Nonomuraea angiospora]
LVECVKVAGPVPFVPADSQPSAHGQPSPNPYAPPGTDQPNQYAPPGTDQPNPYAPPADQQPNPYAPPADRPNPYAPPEAAPNAFADQAFPTPAGDTAPSVPYPPAAEQQQQPPYFGQSAFDQQGGQPFTGYSGREYATPPAYQEPDPPVDPRSQQLMDAYQQAETYQHSTGQHSTGQHAPGQHSTGQHSTAGTQPELRVPDYSSQAPRPYDDPFGHPQHLQQGGYEPQQGQYQPTHQAPQQQQPWPHQAEPVGDATMRLDSTPFGGGYGARPGDDPIDPTAIYTPNEPRR